MKKSVLFAGLILTAVFASCEQKIEKSFTQSGNVQLEATFASGTRTSLDGLVCSWSNDDAIVVNGETSTGIEVLAGGKVAKFTFPIIDAPYYGIYPASAYVESSYDADNGAFGKVLVPATQNYVAGTFDPAAAIMVGVQDEDGKGIAFTHAMSYLRVVVSGSDTDAISQVQVWANAGENMSGTFTFDPATTSITEERLNGNAVTLDCGAGAPQGQHLIVAIPSKDYTEGISIRIKDVNNHYQILKSA